MTSRTASNLQDRTSMKPPEPASRSSSDAGGLRELSASEINQSTGPRQYSVEKKGNVLRQVAQNQALNDHGNAIHVQSMTASAKQTRSCM